MIIETEAYYLKDKASHASLGYTEKRKALFMPPGTIYMYYARGKPSLNISSEGVGNAVLIKSGIVFNASEDAIKMMQRLNPLNNHSPRLVGRLCSGQTLLCRSLAINVSRWDQRQFDPDVFFIADVGVMPQDIIQTTRLGIPAGRDEHLLYRFYMKEYVKHVTKK